MKSVLRGEFEHPRLMTHLDRLCAWKKGEFFFPVTVEVAPAGRCNQRCIFCYANYLNYPHEQIEPDRLVSLVTEMAQVGVKNVYFQGIGEPLLNPATPDAIVAAKQAGLPSLFLVTNGVLLNEAIAEKILSAMTASDMIRVSVFENDPTRYCAIHRCGEKQWHSVVANIKTLVAVRARLGTSPVLSATVYPFPQNLGNLYENVSALRDLGFDMVTVTSPLRQEMNPDQDWPDDLREKHWDELKRIPELETDTFIANLNLRQFEIGEEKLDMTRFGCQGIDFFSHVGPDGGVYPCYRYWLQEDYCYGSLHEQSFADIWKSERRAEIRQRVLATGPDPNKCSNCVQCRTNQSLWQLSNGSRFSNLVTG